LRLRLFLLVLLLFLLPYSCRTPQPQEQVPGGEIETTAYFSPKGGCEEAVIDLINHSKNTIDVAIYSFTDRKIARALIKAHNRGVKIRVIIDYGNGKSRYCVGPLLEKAGIPVRYKRGSGGGLMHNKYAIYDKKILSTGSFNWTSNANKRNDENLVIIKNDSHLIELYQKNFNKLWKLAELTN